MASSARTKTAAPPAPPSATRYEDDLYTWVGEQVAHLHAGRFSEVDALNVAEELSDVGRSEYHKLQSAITVLSLHLLKWDHQPAKRSRSWELSIYEQRERIADSLADNPGLKFRLPDAILRGYKYGRVDALKETKLPKSVLPIDCPFSFDDLMTRPIVYEPPAPKRKKR